MAYPETGIHPGVVLIHEIFGLNDHIKDVANRLAKEGYVVLAPHLYSSEKFSDILTEENIVESMKFMFSIPPEKQRDPEYRKSALEKLTPQQNAAVVLVFSTLIENRPVEEFTKYLSSSVEYLLSTKKTNGKIGSWGFCFGGNMSANLACTGKTDASVIFYGENPPTNKVKNIKGAILGIYGGEDNRITQSIDVFVKELTLSKKEFIIKVYPGAHHAFFNNTSDRTYNKTVAADAWTTVLEFFNKKLKE